MGNSPIGKQSNTELPHKLTISLLHIYIPKRSKTRSHQNLYTNVNSSIIHNSQKVETPKCLSSDEWINKI